jgi:hypothetical protein
MRQLGFLLLLLLVLLLAAAGGAWIFRAELAQAAALRWLEAQGVQAGLTLEEVEPDRLVVRDLSLGGRPTVEARYLAVTLTWDGLLSPRLEAAELTDATLRLDLTGGPPLGELQPLLAGEQPDRAGDTDALPALPPLQVENLEILADTAVGPADIRLDGRVVPDGEALQADVTLQGMTPVAVFGGRLEAMLAADRIRDLHADLRFTAEEQGLDGQILAELSEVPVAPSGSVSVDLKAGPRAARLLSPLLSSPVAWEGLQLTLDLDGRFPALDAETGMLSWAEAGDWTADVTLTGQSLDWEGVFRDGELLLALDANQTGGSLALLPAQTAEIGAGAFDPALLDGLGLPDDLQAQLAGGGRLRLLSLSPGMPLLTLQRGERGMNLDPALRLAFESGPGAAVASVRGHLTTDDSFTPQLIDLREFNLSLSGWTVGGQQVVSAAAAGRLSGPPETLEGAFDLQGEVAPRLPGLEVGTSLVSWPATLNANLPGERLSLEGPLQLTAEQLARDDMRLARLRAALDARLELAATAPTVTLAAPGTVAADELRFGTRRIERLRADLEENRLSWSGEAGLTHTATVRGAPLELRVAQNGEGLLEADVDPGRWHLEASLPPGGAYGGSFTARNAALVLSDPPLRLEGLSLEGPLPPRPEQALSLAGRLRHTGEPPLLPALDLSGTLEPTENAYTLGLTGRALDDALTAVLNARIRPQAPTVSGSLSLAPIAFAPGGLQPADLTPLLASLKQASGALAASLQFSWSSGGLESSAQVELEDLDFSYDDSVQVSGLAGSLTLDSLTPLRTATPQTLSARRVEAGLPLSDLTAQITVLPEGPDQGPRIQVLTAEARALGGTLMLREGLIDPAAGRQEARLVMRGVSIEELIALLDVEGFSASGSLSGEIPVVVSKGRISIPSARLSNESEGVLRVTSSAVQETLASQSEETGLLAQALENFQYEELGLTIEKPEEGDSRITLKLLGQNPEVLGGQPFDVNVNVNTNLEQILQELLYLMRVVAGETGRAWNAEP